MINWSSFRIIAPPFDERSSGISDVLAVTELTATTYFFFTQLQVPYPNSIKTCEFVLSALQKLSRSTHCTSENLSFFVALGCETY